MPFSNACHDMLASRSNQHRMQCRMSHVTKLANYTGIIAAHAYHRHRHQQPSELSAASSVKAPFNVAREHIQNKQTDTPTKRDLLNCECDRHLSECIRHTAHSNESLLQAAKVAGARCRRCAIGAGQPASRPMSSR